MEDNVLAHYILIELACKVELDSRWNLEPSLACCHTCAHICGTNACGECSKSAVCTGVAVCADDTFAAGYDAFFGKQSVFDAHFSDIIIILDVVLSCKSPALE